jgi:hypothetical protein
VAYIELSSRDYSSKDDENCPTFALKWETSLIESFLQSHHALLR